MDIDDLVSYINGDAGDKNKNKTQPKVEESDQCVVSSDPGTELLAEPSEKEINENDMDEFKRRIQKSE